MSELRHTYTNYIQNILQPLQPLQQKLQPLLQQILHMQHALCADDLTIWTTESSIWEQDAIQKFIETTDYYFKARDLNCTPEKSALQVLQKRTQGR